MAQNQTFDWFPAATGNVQYDENQRRIWQNLYYLRDQQNNGTHARSNIQAGMSGTVTFKDSNNNAVSLVIGGKTFTSLTFANGSLVSAK